MTPSTEPSPTSAPALPYAAPLQRPASSYRWVICALLFLATTINYMDRQLLGLLAPILEKAIHWTETDYGHIVIAFQAAYAIGQVSCGWLIDRWGTKRGYSLSIIVWSFAAAAHGLARSVLGFGVARFALGLGEAGNFPAAIKTVAEWFPKKERALATGIFNSGSTVGAIIAPLIVPPLALAFGWQAAFVVLGATGLLWLILWLALYDRPDVSRRVSPSELAYIRSDAEAATTLADAVEPADAAVEAVIAEPPPVRWGQLLRHRQTWAYNIQSLCVQPIWWFYLFWLPKFFVSHFGLELQKSGQFLAVTYTMSMIGSVSAGLFSAFLLRRGWSVNASRKTALLACALLTIPMTLVAHTRSVWLATALIGLTLAGMQGWASNAYTIVSDLFPKRAVASIVGLGSACGSLAAIVLAEVVGKVLQKTGSYNGLFIVAGLSLPLAVTLLHLLAPRWEPVRLDGLDSSS
ncbi:MAG TPA: MFS transporter [Tepidisphaeraceae bacterium]|nr:MFS transporter [Tepidisphaeraceae bacterium]